MLAQHNRGRDSFDSVVKRPASRAQFIEDDAQSIDIGLHAPVARGHGTPAERHAALAAEGWTHGKLSMMYLRNFIESAQRYEGAPPLTARHSKLLELIDHYAESPELCLSMAFLPGDIQWLNNHMTLHSRTEFLDWEENERRRWLMRLWLNRRERNRYTDTYGYYGIAPDAK